MRWSELTPQGRAAILAVVFVVIVFIAWTQVLSPLRTRAADVERDVTTAEQQLEQMEREIENVPPASEAERASWQESADELLARLAPESELPLLLESMMRLAESQGVEIFVTSESAATVGVAGGGVGASQSEQVLAAVPGARYVPLNCRIYGDYAATGRFLAQVGRLGWVTAFAGVSMERQFPELATDARVIVFFRPDATSQNGNGAETGQSRNTPGRVGQGGGSHG